jgi:nucleoside-triphosphatase
MSQNFFITGLPKAGKTTLLRMLIKDLKTRGLFVGGFISPEEKRSGKRTGFLVQDIESGKIDTLASLDRDGPKVSKYHVDIGSFETIAMLSLSDFQKYDVIIIDEIGPMETKSTVFLDALDEIFSSSTPLIASLHEDMVGNYASRGKVFEIDDSNRQQVYDDIIEEIKSISKKAKIQKKLQTAPQPAKTVKKPGGKKGKAARKKPSRKIGKNPPRKIKPIAAVKKKSAPEKAAKVEAEKIVEKEEKPIHKKVIHKLKDLLGF